MPKAKVDLSGIPQRCEVVQAMMARGWFDIDEFALHVASCPTCQHIQQQVGGSVRRALDDMTADDADAEPRH